MIQDLECSREAKALGALGSFWRDLAESDQAKHILRLSRQTNVSQRFQASTNALAGRADVGAEVSQVELRFTDADIIETGDLDIDETLRSVDQPDPGNTSHHSIPYWGLLLGNVLPLRIQADYESLQCGTDFYIHDNRWLLFKRDPRELFSNRRVLITSGRLKESYSWVTPMLQVPVAPHLQQPVLEYVRRTQTPAAFQRALAAVSGLEFVPSSQILRHIRVVGSQTFYVFERNVIRVTYTHTPLEVGKRYPEGHIIGEGVKVLQATADGKDIAWWRQIDWKGGLVMDPILDWGNIKFIDGDVTVYATTSDQDSSEGSRTHVRLQLTQDFAEESKFWNAVEGRETRSGNYLNGLAALQNDDGTAWRALQANWTAANQLNRLLSLPDEQPQIQALLNSKPVNALDFLFRAILARRSYIVAIHPHWCPYPDRLYAFLARFLPATGTAIIVDYAPDLPIESLGREGSIGFSESVTFGTTNDADPSQSIGDTLDLDYFFDTVTLS